MKSLQAVLLWFFFPLLLIRIHFFLFPIISWLLAIIINSPCLMTSYSLLWRFVIVSGSRLLCGAVSCCYLFCHRWILRFTKTNPIFIKMLTTEWELPSVCKPGYDSDESSAVQDKLMTYCRAHSMSQNIVYNLLHQTTAQLRSHKCDKWPRRAFHINDQFLMGKYWKSVSLASFSLRHTNRSKWFEWKQKLIRIYLI